MSKPYRLINATEYQKIETQLNEALQCWNEQYSLYDLSLSLQLPPKDLSYCFSVIATEHIPLFLIEPHYSTFFNHMLFGAHLEELNQYSQKLMLSLLKTMVHSQHELTLERFSGTTKDWVYPGGTALEITLSTCEQTLKLLLHPDWIYHQLELLQPPTLALKTLDEALAEERITLHAALHSFCLPFKQCTTLQIGDVLVSDHIITEAIELKHKNTPIGHVELGQLLSHKSIRVC